MNPKILIVDDKVENLIALENLLDSFEVDLVRAQSGEEALAQTLDHDFALVLLDVQMPGMNGYEVAELLRGNKKTRTIPIIFVTAASMADAQIFKGYESGAVDYLLKPLNSSIFKSKVGVFIELFQQKEALRTKTTEFNQKLVELEELQQQLEETNEQLLLLSTTDSLTGLLNRRSFEEHYADEWQRAIRAQSHLAIIMMDIDHFKLYNDHYGHYKGDDCLREVAESLKTLELRQLDRIARVGGEEFAIILPETDLEGAQLVSERIRNSIELLQIPHPNASTAVKIVTSSVGCSAVIPEKGLSPRKLMEKADEALYKAKSNGRNCCCSLTMELAELQQGAS